MLEPIVFVCRIDASDALGPSLKLLSTQAAIALNGICAFMLKPHYIQNALGCRLRGISFDYWMLESKPGG